MHENLQIQSPLFWPIHRLAEAFRRGDLSPVEVLEEALVRTDQFNPLLNAYLGRLDEQAREQAKNAEKLFRDKTEDLPLLCGVPISVKDTFELADSITTYGSSLFRENRTEQDCGVVRRLRAVGTVFPGKTNAAEFGQSATTDNRLGDDARNPWDKSLTPGGSSGGAAASVAAGLATAAIGADGGGSIRIPASFTGLFGIKPTFGLCPNESGLRAMSDFIAPGPLTRCVADARTILEILAERKYHRQSLGSESLRVVWCPNPEDRPVDPEVAKVLDSAVTKLSDLGHKVEENRLPLEGWNSAFATLVLAEEQRERGKLLEQSPEQLTDYERKSLEAGRRLTIKDVENARSAHSEYQQRLREFFKDVDIIAIPSTATTAFPIRQRPQEIDGKRVSSLWGAVPFTAPFNVSGNPAVSIPCGLCNNLPVGLQLVGQWNAEELLLNLSEDMENSLEFDNILIKEKWEH